MSLKQTLFGGSSSSGSTVEPGQNKFLQDLFARATAASRSDAGSNFSQSFQPGAQQGFGQLINGQAQGNDELMRILNGERQNENLQGEIDAGVNDISRNFREGILPGINTSAGKAGGAGGSRQGIAQGLAAQGASRDATDFVTRLRSQNFKTGLDASLGAGNQLGSNFASRQAGVASGLNSATDVANLGFGSQFGALANLKSILGNQTVLGGSSQSEGGVIPGLAGLASFSFA